MLGGLDNNAGKLLQIDHLTISAQDSSMYAAQYGIVEVIFFMYFVANLSCIGAKLFEELQAFETVHIVPSHRMRKKYIAPEKGGCCIISKTGESKVSLNLNWEIQVNIFTYVAI